METHLHDSSLVVFSECFIRLSQNMKMAKIIAWVLAVCF